MDKYSVKLMSGRCGIWTASMITLPTHCWSRERPLIWWGRIEDAILSLETMPYRCPERKRGAYANRGIPAALCGELHRRFFGLTKQRKL